MCVPVLSNAPFLKSLGSNEPIRTAIMLACNAAGEVCTTIDQALLNLVKISCLKHKITTSPHERIAYTILKVRIKCFFFDIIVLLMFAFAGNE